MTLKYQYVLRYQPRSCASAQSSVVIGAMDIDADPACSRAIDPDKVFGSSPGLDDTMASVAVKATWIGIALATAWPPDTIMAAGSSLTPEIYTVQWQQAPWISTWTLAAVRP